ncbi:hypothetical protein N9J72_03215 [Candidatus Gracilibacteria bacterium]|nr:hypothetical protein [Candidatus Gracilibacteria bacterium]
MNIEMQKCGRKKKKPYNSERENRTEYKNLLLFIAAYIDKELKERVLRNTLSSEQQEIAQTEILEMQTMLAASMQELMKNSLMYFQQATHYRETGDFDMNLKLNIDTTDIDSGISLSDYTGTNHMFDQELRGEIEAFLKGAVDGESVDIEMQTLLDFMMTEGNMYLLMENLNFIDSSDDTEFEEFIRPFIEKLEELASSKTYIAFEGINLEEVLALYQAFSLENTDMFFETMKTTPLFEAYSMNEESYMIRPTLEFCNLGKKASQVFDPFYDDNTCSDSQYQDMLQDMQDEGVSLMLTIADENILSFTVDNDYSRGNIDVTWKDAALTSVMSQFVDVTNPTENTMTFSYIPNETLSANFMAENEVQMNLDALFESNGSLSSVMMDINVEEILQIDIDYAQSILSATAEGVFEGVSFTCSADGQIQSDLMNITEECIINSEALGFVFPGEDTLSIDSTFRLDTRQDRNNIALNVTATTSTTSIFNLSIENTGTRLDIAPSTISAPENSIRQEEAFSEIYQNMYGDSGYDPYNKTDEVTGENLICYEYELNEETDYSDCVKYVGDDYSFDEYYTVDEYGEYVYCNEYQYSENDNYDYCIEYISE